MQLCVDASVPGDLLFGAAHHLASVRCSDGGEGSSHENGLPSKHQFVAGIHYFVVGTEKHPQVTLICQIGYVLQHCGNDHDRDS